MNFFKRSPPPPVLPPPKQNFHQRFQKDDLAKRSMPLGEFSSNPPPVWTFGHFRCIHEKIDGGHFGENSSMGPRIGDGDTELWRGKRIRNSPGKHHGTRNLPDPRGYLGTPPVSPPSAAPGTPWIRAVRPLPGISHAPLWDWCQTASKTDPQSASNFDPLELSVMASPRGRGGELIGFCV